MKLFVLSAFISLTAQAQSLEPATVVSVHQKGNLMPPMEISARPVETTFKVQVASGGCTDSNSFQIDVQSQGGFYLVSFLRVTADLCEAYLPAGTVIELKTNKLPPQSNIKVTNPLFVTNSFVH